MKLYRFITNCTFLIFYLLFFSSVSETKQKLVLATTTSVLDSGLYDVLIPPFEKKYNCIVKILAVGSGQAFRIAKDGNADVLLVHDRSTEEEFVKEGFGIKRSDVMHNNFIIVGPKNDPAKIKGCSAITAFKNIYKNKSLFISRGDNSGTHKKELSIWKKVNSDGWQVGSSYFSKWYIESGSGMEVTLRIANEKNAYCLVDRATWISHKKEFDVLVPLVDGDKELFNPYSVILVSPIKFPWVNYRLAKKFVDFICGQEGQKIIKTFGVEKFGEPLFYPDIIK